MSTRIDLYTASKVVHGKVWAVIEIMYNHSIFNEHPQNNSWGILEKDIKQYLLYRENIQNPQIYKNMTGTTVKQNYNFK